MSDSDTAGGPGSNMHSTPTPEQRRMLLGRWEAGLYIRGELDTYNQWLEAKGRTPKQRKSVVQRARVMCRLCKWRFFEDISVSQLEIAVARFIKDGKRCRSQKTANDWLKGPVQMARFLCRPRGGQYRENPLAGVELYKITEKPRHPRRAMTKDEFLRLIRRTKRGGRWRRLSAADRVAMYELKFFCGLRTPEITSLTCESFSLDTNPPTVTVAAAYSKHRKQDVLLLLPELVDHLRPWLARKKPGRRLWKTTDKLHKMFKLDLARAGIPYVDDQGRFCDLHGLRHSFLTIIGQNPNCSLKTLQTLARHSDVRITARYLHTSLAEQLDALRSLPMPPAARIRPASTVRKPLPPRVNRRSRPRVPADLPSVHQTDARQLAIDTTLWSMVEDPAISPEQLVMAAIDSCNFPASEGLL
jgi:integrase